MEAAVPAQVGPQKGGGEVTEAERCLAEIARCEEHLRGGGPDEAGAFLGLMDWRNELRLIEGSPHEAEAAARRE